MDRIENGLEHMHLQWFGDTDENSGSTDENQVKQDDDVTKNPKVIELLAEQAKKNDEAIQQAKKDAAKESEKKYQSVNDQLRTQLKEQADKGLSDAEKLAKRVEELEASDKKKDDLLQHRDWLESESRIATEKGLESGVLDAIRAVQAASTKRDPDESTKAIEALVAELKTARDAEVNKRLAGGKDETPQGGESDKGMTVDSFIALSPDEQDKWRQEHPDGYQKMMSG